MEYEKLCVSDFVLYSGGKQHEGITAQKEPWQGMKRGNAQGDSYMAGESASPRHIAPHVLLCVSELQYTGHSGKSRAEIEFLAESTSSVYCVHFVLHVEWLIPLAF